ncbi:MAG: hypothetical protein ACJA0E_001166 [Bermanella sp.]|jgi:hypothetical protein
MKNILIMFGFLLISGCGGGSGIESEERVYAAPAPAPAPAPAADKFTLSTISKCYEEQCFAFIQAEGASLTYTEGGDPTSALRTVYIYSPDINSEPTYIGQAWPYIVVEDDVEDFDISPEITAEITKNSSNMVLINGQPIYQYTNDSTSETVEGNGSFYGAWWALKADGVANALGLRTISQVGELTQGSGLGDQYGNSIALNQEGTRMVVGAPRYSDSLDNAGQVTVLSLENNNWTVLGNKLEGQQQNAHFGKKVAINNAGDTIASGYFFDIDNQSDLAVIKVFKLMGSEWLQLGSDISGANIGDLTNASISLNEQGYVLAIGQPSDHTEPEFAGRVRIFQFDAGDWHQLGQDINGDINGDSSGASISLNDAGDLVAIGSPTHSFRGDGFGQVRVFKFTNGSWDLLGSKINGEYSGGNLGTAIALSGDGSTLVAGAPFASNSNKNFQGAVKIFELIESQWTLSGNFFGEVAGDNLGASVSISKNGKFVAMAAPKSESVGEVLFLQDIGFSKVGYWFDSGVYRAQRVLGELEYGGFGYATSVSNRGSTAISQPLGTNVNPRSGSVTVYQLE